jgi:hypothetical protein
METEGWNEVVVSNGTVPSSDCLCGLLVRVPGHAPEMYCASSEVRTEFIYAM